MLTSHDLRHGHPMTSKGEEEELLLVCDCGGTSTRCLVYRTDGSLLTSGSAVRDMLLTLFLLLTCIQGESNTTDVGIDVAIRTILYVLASLKLPTRTFASVWLGVAGADDAATCQRFHSTLLSLSPDLLPRPQDLLVTNDCDLLASAIISEGAEAGIVLIAGTGSNAMVFTPSSSSSLIPLAPAGRIGGWGSVLGDEGSAHWIGREALRRILAHRFDISPAALFSPSPPPSDHFTTAILKSLGATNIDDLLTAAHAGNSDVRKARIASLAKVVSTHAFLTPTRDSCAHDIMNEAALFHVRCADALAQASLSEFAAEKRAIALGGGCWTSEGFRRLFEERLRESKQHEGTKVVFVEEAAKSAGVALARQWSR